MIFFVMTFVCGFKFGKNGNFFDHFLLLNYMNIRFSA